MSEQNPYYKDRLICHTKNNEINISGPKGSIIVTSFPIPRTKKAELNITKVISLWAKAGFETATINGSEEAKWFIANKEKFNQLSVVEWQASKPAEDEKMLIPIHIAFEACFMLSERGCVTGIANGDIYPNIFYDWSSIVSSISNSQVHAFQRLEDLQHDQLEIDPFTPFRNGYDLFLFRNTSSIQAVSLNSESYQFKFSTPWWDYWFPLNMIQAGFSVIVHDRPFISHFTHEQAWSGESYLRHSKVVYDLIISNYFNEYHYCLPDKFEETQSFADKIANIALEIINCHYPKSLVASHVDSNDNCNGGVSIVSACMNRNENLIKALPSWLAHDLVKEIIIVDWSSREPVANTLKENGIKNDSRIKIIREDGRNSWCLTQAFNVGIRASKSQYILKLDSDIVISEGFFHSHPVSNFIFYAGNWRIAANDNETRINGSFMAPRSVLNAIGLYNEFITTYGWDDSELYERLALVLRRKDFDYKFIKHLPQPEESRLENQKSRLGLSPVFLPDRISQNLEIRVNQVYARIAPSPLWPFSFTQDNISIARYLAYRFSLIRSLHLPFTEGGIGEHAEELYRFDLKTLQKLSTDCLALLYSFRHSNYVIEVFDRNYFNSYNRQSIVTCFMRLHPISATDYKILKDLCDKWGQEVPPNPVIHSQENLYPKIRISSEFSCCPRISKVKANLTHRFSKYLSILPEKLTPVCDSILGTTSSKKEATIFTVCLLAEKFTQGFLHDVKLAIEHDNDHLFVFVLMPNTTLANANEFSKLAKCHPKNIICLYLSWDPGLYECWNIVIRSSKSKYLGNWNSDDSRKYNHISHLTDMLEKNPSILGASTALYVSRQPSNYGYAGLKLDSLEIWFQGKDFEYDFTDMFSHNEIIKQQEQFVSIDNFIPSSQNFMHCLPIWRREIHEDIGYFDEETYGPSADWEFWLRASRTTSKKFMLSGVPSACYYLNPSSYGRKSDAEIKEKRICAEYFESSKSFRIINGYKNYSVNGYLVSLTDSDIQS